MSPLSILVVAVAAYTLAAAVIDVRTQRIPNYLTLPTALLGIAFHAFAPQGWGLSTALAGLAIGFALLLPPCLLGGGGMGDVKLLAALGAWLGPKLILVAFAVSILAAAFLAIGLLMYSTLSRGLHKTERTYLHAGRHGSGSPRPQRVLPFALPVALGSSLVLIWLVHQQSL